MHTDPDLPLVLDIDGTLLRTDLLMETFWAAMARDMPATLAVFASSFASSFASPARLKRRLLEIASPDIDLMPVREPILRMARDALEDGRAVHLASGADRAQVEAVAKRFGLPGEYFGSDDPHNLTGAAKARVLVARFGERGFDYAGNAPVDLPVWRHARAVVAVAPGRRLARRLEELDRPVRIVRDEPDPGAVLREMRPGHWVKNLLLLLPLIAAHAVDPGALLRVLVAMAGFSFGASALYVVNDLLDLDADRRHPEKRRRPVASGALPIRDAMILCLGLAVLAPLLAWQAGPVVALLTVVYMASSLAYSLRLKRLAWIDLTMLAWMFLLRIGAGIAAARVDVSAWLPAFVFAACLSLAAVKRITGLTRAHRPGHLPGRGYDVTHLPALKRVAILAAGGAVAFFLAYAFGPVAAPLYAAPGVFALAAIPLCMWFARVIRLSARGEEDYDIAAFVAHDGPGLALVAAGVALALLAV